MLTTPITTSHFHSRVLTLLSSHLSNLQPALVDNNGTRATTQNTRPLVIPPLSPADSHLRPNEAMSQVVGVTSPWIDLCSPDPLIADISRQVLMLEVVYAAFCGIGYLLVSGPKLHHGDLHSEGIPYYARAIQDALNAGPYIQFHIWLRTVDSPDLEVDQIGDLAPHARVEFFEGTGEDSRPKIDPFGTWEAWDIIRRTCKYHARLFVGKNMYHCSCIEPLLFSTATMAKIPEQLFPYQSISLLCPSSLGGTLSPYTFFRSTPILSSRTRRGIQFCLKHTRLLYLVSCVFVKPRGFCCATLVLFRVSKAMTILTNRTALCRTFLALGKLRSPARNTKTQLHNYPT